MKSALLTMDRWLRRMDLVLIAMAGMAVLSMMGVTFVDVFLRYVFNRPLSWAYDLITQYLLVASFFFAFSYALRANENVAVDVFAQKLSPSAYSVLMALGHGIAAVIFAYVVWLTARDAHEAWVNNDAFVGALVWPTWLAKSILPVGALALTLRLAHRSLAYLVGRHDATWQDALHLEQNTGAGLREHT